MTSPTRIEMSHAFRELLVSEGVSPALISYMESKSVTTMQRFANYCDNRTEVR